MIELCCDPPIHGRELAGHSSTASNHQPAATTIAAPAANSCAIRLPSFGGPPIRYVSARGGTTSSTCNCLARNPNPINPPVSSNQRQRPSATARVIAHAAPIIRNTSSASGLLNRNISTATGVTARAVPAINPAAGPNDLRTVAHNSATLATPSRTCGTSMLQLLSPNSRTESSITHSEAGGLSTVIELAASEEPKKNASHDCEPACIAAA